jgi:hypothetical protein
MIAPSTIHLRIRLASSANNRFAKSRTRSLGLGFSSLMMRRRRATHQHHRLALSSEENVRVQSLAEMLRPKLNNVGRSDDGLDDFQKRALSACRGPSQKFYLLRQIAPQEKRATPTLK